MPDSIALVRGGETCDRNVDRIGSEILEGFAQLGWLTTEIDISRQGMAPLHALCATIEQGALTALLSIQSMGSVSGMESLLEKGGTRRIFWALDPVFSDWGKVMALPAGSIVTYPSRADVACAKAFLRPDLTVMTVAHGARPAPVLPWEQRDIAILYSGNLSLPPERIRAAWPAQVGEFWSQTLNVMVELWQSSPLMPLAEMAMRALHGRRPTIERNDFFLLQKQFHDYATARVRHDYVQALHDLPLTLIGRGWDGVAGPRHRCLGALPTGEVRAMAARAQVVLNLSPLHYRSHERVYEGMAAGAAVFTTGQAYLANALDRDEDAADHACLGYLADPATAAATIAATDIRRLAEQGLAEFQARHGWRHRAAQLAAQFAPVATTPR